MSKDKDYCPRCSGDLLPKKGCFGDFFGCSNWPKCKFATKARAHKRVIDTDFRDPQVLPGHYEGGKR